MNDVVALNLSDTFMVLTQSELLSTMIRKMVRYVKILTVVALPVILVFTIVNVLLLSRLGHHSHETTLILKEKIYNKGSDGSSSKDAAAAIQRGLHAGAGPEFAAGHAKVEEERARERSADGETSKRRKEADDAPGANIVRDDRVEMKDQSIDAMIQKLKSSSSVLYFFPSFFWNLTMAEMTRKLGAVSRRSASTLEGYDSIKQKPDDPPLPHWKLVHRNIRRFSLYDPDDPNLEALMSDLRNLPITETEENEGGTQFKLNVRFSDGGRAVIKFMRYPREVEASENHYIFDDIERHVAEIAAFQLDKVLGFYRVPPTTGRKFNITSELKPIAPDSMYKTLFYSPAGNLCFFGKCDYYCNSAHAFCGHPDVIEGSVMSYLPSRNIATRKSWYQPWRRSYSKFRKAYWETNDDLCDKVRQDDPYNNGKILLDMIDSHTFDFLSGNKDRHSFATFKEWGNYTFPIMYDNGRGFGRQTYDAMSILAPLTQCCIIRKSTLLKYLKLYMGPERLSSLMEDALKPDPVAPVLIRPHLNALDRRLIKILQAVAKCIEEKGVSEVVQSDKF
ncbi:extracellular serine/threonine protein CG31145-like isoform X2 [Dreissena polymorpha]|uniref:extracellular serine/threonine protein CG31145-like isoform X2 n=1 Tax=Dreissena polymorpha TaxID=45954 RepID=UPI002263E853|nr:extracellular serine/threonine protein CG31145-like isoform X2 [Dreissena polymorpha]